MLVQPTAVNMKSTNHNKITKSRLLERSELFIKNIPSNIRLKWKLPKITQCAHKRRECEINKSRENSIDHDYSSFKNNTYITVEASLSCA